MSESGGEYDEVRDNVRNDDKGKGEREHLSLNERIKALTVKSTF